jgi:hypothetical protein
MSFDFSSSSSMTSSYAVVALGPRSLSVDQAGAGVGAAAFGEDLVAGERRDRLDVLDLLRDGLQLRETSLVRSSVVPGGVWTIA